VKVENNKVISIHYKLSEAGNVLEDSHQSQPIVYLHGHKGLFPALEEALLNKTVGDKVSITLSPEQTYGERNENAIQRVSLKHIVNKSKKKEKYKPGMIVYLNTQQGPQPAIVVKVGLKSLDVDINHPFAGKTLDFDVEILDIRDANAEEIDHGHVHGEGGHHH